MLNDPSKSYTFASTSTEIGSLGHMRPSIKVWYHFGWFLVVSVQSPNTLYHHVKIHLNCRKEQTTSEKSETQCFLNLWHVQA
jgi:hypothetical protein